MNDCDNSTALILPRQNWLSDDQREQLRIGVEELLSAAAKGNIDVIRLFQETADRINYNQLLTNMDDDEFTPTDFTDQL